jgi:hypothetical protein
MHNRRTKFPLVDVEEQKVSAWRGSDQFVVEGYSQI